MFAHLGRKSLNLPPSGALPVQIPDELLKLHQSRLDTICQVIGVPEKQWEVLYLPSFRSFAGFVQQLPASEAHHHAGPGGLLSHSLEVVLHSLKLRRGHLLPPGASAEQVAAQEALWTYATTTGALLHDIGKPMTDQRVRLFDGTGTVLGDWQPLLGPMPATTHWYQVEFVRGRKHRFHDKVTSLLCRTILPDEGLRWLASSPRVLEAWLAAISWDTEAAGILGQLVQQADRLSVSANLSGESGRLPTARYIPLHERLLTGLRYLLHQHLVPLNRKGAAGWLTGEDVWLVSKRILDMLREHLEHEGQCGIPSRNDRLMDELQQHNVVIPNGDRAIWNVEVSVNEWAQSLTVLRIPACRLWPDPAAWPDSFSGTVKIFDKTRADENDGMTTNRPSIATVDQSAAKAEAVPQEPASCLGQRPTPKTGNDFEQHRENETQGDAAQNSQPDNPDGYMDASVDEEDAGQRFLEWLQHGVSKGQFAINTVNARLHVASEGLLLVSPAIFKDYDAANWNHVQKRFQKLRLHRKTSRGTNIFTYKVEGARKQGRIRVYVLPNVRQLVPDVAVLPPNPHLSLLE